MLFRLGSSNARRSEMTPTPIPTFHLRTSDHFGNTTVKTFCTHQLVLLLQLLETDHYRYDRVQQEGQNQEGFPLSP